jgi:hypothetical protein
MASTNLGNSSESKYWNTNTTDQYPCTNSDSNNVLSSHNFDNNGKTCKAHTTEWISNNTSQAYWSVLNYANTSAIKQNFKLNQSIATMTFFH